MSVCHKFGNDSLVCHAFNGSCTELAISANSNEVLIFAVPSGSADKFQQLDALVEHNALVTGIDWAPKTNRIVTCSVERNAYVWTKQADDKWKPTLVVLQINRAATCCRWSPLENKFAVGSGARMIAVCYFEQENDWWVSKHIKKPIRSTVTCLDWHPNNALLGCGSTDFKARVFAASLKSVDDKPGESVWGKKTTFQNLMFEGSSGSALQSKGGWVHSVSFSSDGTKFAWVGHDATLSVAHAGSGSTPVVVTIRQQWLPFTTLTWIGSATLLVAGHDCCPLVFVYKPDSGVLVYIEQLDVKDETRTEAKQTAMRKFRAIDRLATSDTSGTILDTVHQNTINEIRIMRGDKSRARQISTVGRDGLLVIWDLPTLEERIAGLKIQ